MATVTGFALAPQKNIPKQQLKMYRLHLNSHLNPIQINALFCLLNSLHILQQVQEGEL